MSGRAFAFAAALALASAAWPADVSSTEVDAIYGFDGIKLGSAPRALGKRKKVDCPRWDELDGLVCYRRAKKPAAEGCEARDVLFGFVKGQLAIVDISCEKSMDLCGTYGASNYGIAGGGGCRGIGKRAAYVADWGERDGSASGTLYRIDVFRELKLDRDLTIQ